MYNSNKIYIFNYFNVISINQISLCRITLNSIKIDYKFIYFSFLELALVLINNIHYMKILHFKLFLESIYTIQ